MTQLWLEILLVYAIGCYAVMVFPCGGQYRKDNKGCLHLSGKTNDRAIKVFVLSPIFVSYLLVILTAAIPVMGVALVLDWLFSSAIPGGGKEEG